MPPVLCITTSFWFLSFFSLNCWSFLLVFVFAVVRHWVDIFIELFTITLRFCFWVVLASWELHIHFIKLELSFFSWQYFTFVFIELHLVFYCPVLWSPAATLLNQSSFLLLSDLNFVTLIFMIIYEYDKSYQLEYMSSTETPLVTPFFVKINHLLLPLVSQLASLYPKAAFFFFSRSSSRGLHDTFSGDLSSYIHKIHIPVLDSFTELAQICETLLCFMKVIPALLKCFVVLTSNYMQ